MLKKLLVSVLLIGSLISAKYASATCNITSSFTDGQVLTASQLNTFVTDSENCVQAVLDGDTFTGNMNWNSGTDALFYSDTGSTLNAAIYGDNGESLGCPRGDGAYGLNLSYGGSADGLLTIECNQAACSALNPSYISMASTTAGDRTCLKIVSSLTMIDDYGSSDLTNLGFGITEASNWNEDAPFFLYAINRANSDIDGADGSSVIALSRSPAMITSPSSANSIGDTAAIPSDDGQTVILILDDVTIANYTSLPVQLIGAIRMRWDTGTDDWTVQTLNSNDGIGESQLAKTFDIRYNFPLNQNGAATGTFILDNGGTAPIFSTNTYTYMISKTGIATIFLNIMNDGGGDGAGAVTSLVSLPYSNFLDHSYEDCVIYFTDTVTPRVGIPRIQASTSNFDIEMQDTDANLTDTVQNADFLNGGRGIRGICSFKAF